VANGSEIARQSHRDGYDGSTGRVREQEVLTMSTRTWRQRWTLAATVAVGLVAFVSRLSAQSHHMARLPSIGGPEVISPAVARFTLDEAKWRA
jgi:hypothetical protein